MYPLLGLNTQQFQNYKDPLSCSSITTSTFMLSPYSLAAINQFSFSTISGMSYKRIRTVCKPSGLAFFTQHHFLESSRLFYVLLAPSSFIAESYSTICTYHSLFNHIYCRTSGVIPVLEYYK